MQQSGKLCLPAHSGLGEYAFDQETRGIDRHTSVIRIFLQRPAVSDICGDLCLRRGQVKPVSQPLDNLDRDVAPSTADQQQCSAPVRSGKIVCDIGFDPHRNQKRRARFIGNGNRFSPFRSVTLGQFFQP